MKARYILKDQDVVKHFEYPVIMPQGMSHSDGFVLLGFEGWEQVNDEKFCAAVTNIAEFHIENTKGPIGFTNEN